jgi:AcrR family transcriptional regulator
VLGTTLELLEEAGVGSLSVDEVARRSGVAKTTIYRHWPTRHELILDACTRMATEGEVPDTGSLERDLTTILLEIADLLATARWSSVLPSIVDAAEHDPEFAAVHAQIQRGHAEPLRVVLERARSRGELPKAVKPADTIPLLLGPLFYRRWFSREAVDPAFVRLVVRRAVAG